MGVWSWWESEPRARPRPLALACHPSGEASRVSHSLALRAIRGAVFVARFSKFGTTGRSTHRPPARLGFSSFVIPPFPGPNREA